MMYPENVGPGCGPGREFLDAKDNVTGIVNLDPDRGPQRSAKVQLQYLRKLVNVAEELDLDKCHVWIVPNPNDRYPALVVTPRRDSQMGLMVCGMTQPGQREPDGWL